MGTGGDRRESRGAFGTAGDFGNLGKEGGRAEAPNGLTHDKKGGGADLPGGAVGTLHMEAALAQMLDGIWTKDGRK